VYIYIDHTISPQLTFTTEIRGSNTDLIMTSSTYASKLIGEFLSTMDPDAPRGTQGRKMMLQKLGNYLWWKGKLSDQKPDEKPQTIPDSGRTLSGGLKPTDENEGLSEAMLKKDREKSDKTARRRRVRGGAPAGSDRSRPIKIEEQDSVPGEGEMRFEADRIAQL
jgi:DNA excision repair protein ERCC-4